MTSKIAIYTRVSRNNPYARDGDTEMSIDNQVLICLEFIKDRFGVEAQGIYCDSGYTGVNFQRPGFEKMIKDIDKEGINTVIVTELSRLGRNYIEVGQWLQINFPNKGVRFISIYDEYDSKKEYKGGFPLTLGLKSLIHEAYSQDISLKLRSAQKVMRKEGVYIGGHVTYGYKRSEIIRGRLSVDEDAARIVRFIFEEKIKKKSCAEIANLLNDQEVLAPSEYKRKNKSNHQTSFKKYEKAKWYPATVERIIKNRIYIGTIEQGKTRKPNYKSKQEQKVPREEWDVCENMHSPIVSWEKFESANKELIGGTRKPTAPFGGVLFCGDCGKPMVRKISKWKDKKRVYYICSTKNKGQGCSRHCVKEETVFEYMKRSDKPIKILVYEGGRLEVE